MEMLGESKSQGVKGLCIPPETRLELLLVFMMIFQGTQQEIVGDRSRCGDAPSVGPKVTTRSLPDPERKWTAWDNLRWTLGGGMTPR